ncbi:MAG: class I SAM-dependent methyltransferase [Rhodospirillales bacterium]
MGEFTPDFYSMHPDRRLGPVLASFPADLFSDTLWRSIAWAELYVDALVVEVVARLDLVPPIASGLSAEALCARAGLVSGFTPRAAWLLDRLVARGLLFTEGGREAPLYGATQPLPTIDLPGLRASGVAIDPGNRATAALLDAACSVWPRVARGETNGEDALLGAGEIALWLDYFANSNALYAANNRLAAHVAAERLQRSADWAILELGAGAGSGTEALLEEFANRGCSPQIKRYVVSEPSAFFRRRGERRLAGRVERPTLSFRNLDIDHSWAEQGFVECNFDLVFAVNVLHVADDLAFSLREVRRHLRPGGWLVAGECLRPFPGYPVYIEFVFRLLDSFLKVKTDTQVRPEAGFLTPEAWQQAASCAGFTEVEIVPDHVRIRQIEPRFSLGAICAR